MAEPEVTVIARRPYVRGAIAYERGDPFRVPVLEAVRLERQGIVSLSKRPGAKPVTARAKRKIKKAVA